MNKEKKITKKSVQRTIRGIANGSILTSDFIRNHLVFIAFLGILGIIYIANSYHAQKVFRETKQIKKEIEELRTEKILIESQVMQKSRREEVLIELKKYDSELREPNSPPYIITNR